MPRHTIAGREKKDIKDTADSSREILEELQKMNETLCKILNHQRTITNINKDEGEIF